MSKLSARIDHIDYAKAIGMILIISSHIGVTPILRDSFVYRLWDNILNSFYVPLFFILSGIFETSIKNRVDYFYRLIHLLKHILFFLLFGFISAGLLKGDWKLSHYAQNSVVWFLITLFWLKAIFGLIKNIKYSWLVVLVLTIAGLCLSHNNRSFIYLGQSLLCIPFYAIGYLYKDFLKIREFILWRSIIYLFCWFISFYFCYSPQNLSINFVTQNYFAFYVEAIFGSLFLIELCKCLQCNILLYFGRNTIVPMMVQYFFIWLITSVWLIVSMCEYWFCSIVINTLCLLVIPIFRNKKYNLFS